MVAIVRDNIEVSVIITAVFVFLGLAALFDGYKGLKNGKLVAYGTSNWWDSLSGTFIPTRFKEYKGNAAVNVSIINLIVGSLLLISGLIILSLTLVK